LALEVCVLSRPYVVAFGDRKFSLVETWGDYGLNVVLIRLLSIKFYLFFGLLSGPEYISWENNLNSSKVMRSL